jgi:arabinofuranan 3-O-arabinosyltransferase
VWRDLVLRLDRLNPRAQFLVACAAWAFAACAAVLQVAFSVRHANFGLDLGPIYRAGRATLHHRPVYDVPNFVYPPTAALAAVPLTVVPLHALSWVFLGVEIVIVAGIATTTISWFVPRRWLPAAAGLVSGALLLSHLAVHSLWLDNVSLLLAASTILACWLIGRGRWVLACAVLVIGLLLKPLLLPLVLIPLLARRPRELLLAAAGGTVLLLASLPFTAGLGQLPSVARKLAGGSVLVGRASANNLSLRGLADYHGLPAAPILVLRVAVCLAALWACVVFTRSGARLDMPGAAALVSLLMLAVFLAGTLSEVHYLFVTVAGGCASLLLSRRLAVRIPAVIGIGATLFPLRHLQPSVHQGVLMLSEVAFFVAVTLALTDRHGRMMNSVLAPSDPSAGTVTRSQ